MNTICCALLCKLLYMLYNMLYNMLCTALQSPEKCSGTTLLKTGGGTSQPQNRNLFKLLFHRHHMFPPAKSLFTKLTTDSLLFPKLFLFANQGYRIEFVETMWDESERKSYQSLEVPFPRPEEKFSNPIRSLTVPSASPLLPPPPASSLLPLPRMLSQEPRSLRRCWRVPQVGE